MRLLPVALVALLVAPALADDKPWDPPKDGVMTEKQADAWLDYMDKLARRREELRKWGEEHKSSDTAASIKAMQDFEADIEKLKKGCGLKEEEREWVGKQIMEIHTTCWLYKKVQDDWTAKKKELDEKVAAAEKAKADLAKAKKSGRRPLSKEEREQLQAAADEEVKNAEQVLKDAKAALDEAKKGEDEDAKKTAQDGVTEAQKNLDAAKKRAKDVDLPQNDDEKAALEKELAEKEKEADAAIASAKDEREQSLKSYKEFLEKPYETELKKHPAKNVEIVKPRGARIQAAYETVLTGVAPKEKK